MKNLENFYKSIQILVSLSEVWTCNLMITSLVSYPLDHRGKLENLAVYVYFIIKIQKIPLLANEMYKLQTHFGFTNLCSKVASFCPVSSQKVKNWTRTPCKQANCQEHDERHLIVDVSTQSHERNQQMVMLMHYHREGPKLSQCIASCADTLESFKRVGWHSNCILPAIERASVFWLI